MSSKNLFSQFGLAPEFLLSLTQLGYEKPTPVQERSIPHLMKGEDVCVQARTGTGKTAAFALPALSHIDVELRKPQILVIAPTRELALQVSEAFCDYAKNMKSISIAAIYGGADYTAQRKALKNGAQVIVGTPGRVMDHLRQGKLIVDSIKMVVIDEADEMLKMGFIDDIECILGQITQPHQTAMFSATMPEPIKKIAKRYQKNAEIIHIESKENLSHSIEQFYTLVSNPQKMDVLIRFLEVEEIQAAIIFTKTKSSSSELAGKLQTLGYKAAALNGDMDQSLRQKVIDRIKSGSLNFLVATDVAARGIDVDRISHVINYDMPYDTESYIHRIGRTGRAGRKGKALLFLTPKEHFLLKRIERAVNCVVKQITPPTVKDLRDRRNQQLIDNIQIVIRKKENLKPYQQIIDTITESDNCSARDIAAALVYFIQQSNPLPTNEIDAAKPEVEDKYKNNRNRNNRSHSNRNGSSSSRNSNNRNKPTVSYAPKKRSASGANTNKPMRPLGATARQEAR